MPQNRAVGAQFRFQADSSVKKRSFRLGWELGTGDCNREKLSERLLLRGAERPLRNVREKECSERQKCQKTKI